MFSGTRWGLSMTLPTPDTRPLPRHPLTTYPVPVSHALDM